MKKALKRSLSLLLAIALIFSSTYVGLSEVDWAGIFAVEAKAADSSEVPEGYIGIYTVDDLYNVRNDLAANYILMNDIVLTKATALGGKHDFMGNGWEPIGSDGIYTNQAFSGVFDGNGYKIKGIRIDIENVPSGVSSSLYLGLFANVSGTVKNLTVFGSIEANIDYKKYIGTIAGKMSGGLVENCHSYCDTTITNTSDSVGGIIGEVNDNDSQIINCSNHGDINGGLYVGGIAGAVYNTAAIKECYNVGNLTATATDSKCCCGGIVGFWRFSDNCAGYVENCYNVGDVNGRNCAGLVGLVTYYFYSGSLLSTLYLTNCYNRGSLTGSTKGAAYCSTAATYKSKCIKVESCYYNGGTGVSKDGASLLDEDMMLAQSSYSGFDFENVWVHDFECEYPYPQLKNNRQTKIPKTQSIVIGKLPQTEYCIKDELSTDGGVIVATLLDGTVCEAPLSDATLSAVDMTSEGTKTVTVSYGGATTTYEISVRVEYKEIRTAEDLYNIKNDLTDNYILMNDIDLTEALAEGGKYYNEGHGWHPIGGGSSYTKGVFTGVFNGNNHTIYGLTINSPTPVSGTPMYFGLFANNAGVIKNLFLEDVYFYIEDCGYNHLYVGSVAAKNIGTIENCGVEGIYPAIFRTDTNTSSGLYAPGGNMYVGGLCGSNFGELKSCYNKIQLGSRDKGVGYFRPGVGAEYYFGGICGYSEGNISECANTGFIYQKAMSSNGATVGHDSGFAGICGKLTATAENCFNWGAAKVGISNGGTIKNSYAYIPGEHKGGYLFGGSTKNAGCYYSSGYKTDSSCLATYLSSVEMTIEENFESFDFNNTWFISENPGCHLPQLRSMSCRFIGHNYEWVFDKEPTCTAEGEKSLKCIACGSVKVTEVAPVTHEYSEWNVTIEATSSSTGEKYRTCSLCGNTETEIVPVIPYGYTPIYTAKQLAGIKCGKSTNYILMNDIDLSIDYSSGWKPIGLAVTSPFVGTFDGNGYTISNMYIPDSIYDKSYSSVSGYNGSSKGLFSSVNGVIKNVVIENAYIYGGLHDAANSARYVTEEAGLICGRLEGGEISNCVVSGKITDEYGTSSYTSGNDCGGLVGMCKGPSLISKCAVYCDVQGGAIIGYVNYNYINREDLTIENCYNGSTIPEGFCGATVQPNILTSYNIALAGDSTTFNRDKGQIINAGACTTLDRDELRYQETFEGFDFENTWYIAENSIYPYPQLKSHIFRNKCQHNYSDWATDSEPNCEAVGIRHKTCIMCGDVVIENIDALGHNYSEDWVVSTKPGCEVAGVKYHECTRCSAKSEVVITPPTGHTYSVWTTQTNATCETDGLRTRICSVCEYEDSEIIKAYGHNYSDKWSVDVEPGCVSVGSKSHHCLNCDSKIDVTEIEAYGHSFGSWNITSESSCTENGIKTRTCDVCGEAETKEYEATGHDYSAIWTIDVKPTCTENGVKSHHCLNCDATADETGLSAIGHSYGAWIYDEKATCLTGGSKHRVCENCEETETEEFEPMGHSYSSSWTIDVPVTCTEDGSKSHHCLRCDDKVDITPIESKGHSYGTWLLQTAPTCTDDGVKYRACASCSSTETAPMNALGHDYSTVWTIDAPATCTESGLKSHHCTRCEDKIDITLISATGHFFGAWNVEKEATCTEIGSRSRSCELCSTVENDEIKAYGHEYSTQWTIDVEPTCSATGSKSHHCLRCDDKTDVEEIPFGGHIFGKWYVVTQPTMETAGVRAHKCYNCEMTEEAELPKLLKYTATFVADGDIVATVDFPEDATEIEIPKVPHKDKFNGEWENFEVRNKNFTVNAVYTPIPTEQIDGLNAGNSTDYYASTGEVEINLNVSAPSKTIVTTTTKAVPLDIVFVLDQSGSMADGGKKNALKNAVSSFSNEILADAIANSVDHRIAVVGFASGSNNNLNYQNTELLTADVVKYNEITNADYKNALVSVNDNGALNKVIADAVKAIDAEGATKADLGLEMASNIFANSPAEGGRQRVVVFLTDGVPTSYSNFEYSVANVAIQNAYQLKNTYDATVYSVGVFDRTTSANRAVNNFMNYVSSNYNEEAVMNKYSNETTSNTSGYYLDVSDVDSLSDVFTSIVEETTTHTGRFSNATLKYTLTKYFTLTSVQEAAIRKNAIEALGVTNDQISITRNTDGTTAIVITGVEPWAEGEEFVIDFTFRATANGNTLKSGTYQVGTFESGVILENGEGYEAVFAPNSVDIGGTSGIAVFNINSIPYAINRLSSTTKVVAPATSFGADYNFIGWNVPANLTLNNEVRVFDAELLKNEYKISWNIDGEITEVKYAVGDFIAVPEVGNNSIGGAFVGWDKVIPETMPLENLTITAIYDAHYHKYDVTKAFESCTEGGTLTYTCECGDTYTEEIAPCEHSFEVITASNNQNAIENAGSRCTVCGIKDSKALRLEATATYQMSDASYNTATVELDYVDEQGDKHQPEGDIEISVQLDEVFENDIPENATASVYRVNEDGSRTKLQSEQNGMNMTFTTDHFSTYEFEFTTGEQKYLFAQKGSVVDYENKLIFSNTYIAKDFVKLVSYLAPAKLTPKVNAFGFFGTGTAIDLTNGGATESYKVIVNGDLNGDGVCDALDASRAALASTGKVTATQDEIYAANGDIAEEIDVNNYQAIVNKAIA